MFDFAVDCKEGRLIVAEMVLKVVSGEDVKAKLEEIPPHIINRLARVTVWAIDRFFEKPGVKEDYEKWLVEYKKKQAEREGES